MILSLTLLNSSSMAAKFRSMGWVNIYRLMSGCLVSSIENLIKENVIISSMEYIN